MDKNELKDSLTESDIKKLLEYYNIDYFQNNQGALQMETACHNSHGGSHKLYYYPDSQSFHCFTDCADSFDIYGLVERISATRGESINFNEAYQTVGSIMGVNTRSLMKRKKGFGETVKTIDDWEWISKLKRKKSQKPQFGEINEGLLNKFEEWYPLEWVNEGISLGVQEKFGIRFNSDYNQTVIPHRSPDGELIGIRVRNWRNVERGKYMPLYFEGKLYNHPLGFNLYGLYENKETIQKVKKAMIVEGEKSCLKADSMFGDNSFCVALCGSSMNRYQAELLMDLGVEEVIIALDKDYLMEPDKKYKDKVKNIARLFINKVSVYHITDTRGVLDHKSCLLDADKETVINVMEYDKHLMTEI